MNPTIAAFVTGLPPHLREAIGRFPRTYAPRILRPPSPLQGAAAHAMAHGIPGPVGPRTHVYTGEARLRVLVRREATGVERVALALGPNVIYCPSAYSRDATWSLRVAAAIMWPGAWSTRPIIYFSRNNWSHLPYIVTGTGAVGEGNEANLNGWPGGTFHLATRDSQLSGRYPRIVIGPDAGPVYAESNAAGNRLRLSVAAMSSVLAAAIRPPEGQRVGNPAPADILAEIPAQPPEGGGGFGYGEEAGTEDGHDYSPNMETCEECGEDYDRDDYGSQCPHCGHDHSW